MPRFIRIDTMLLEILFCLNCVCFFVLSFYDSCTRHTIWHISEANCNFCWMTLLLMIKKLIRMRVSRSEHRIIRSDWLAAWFAWQTDWLKCDKIATVWWTIRKTIREISGAFVESFPFSLEGIRSLIFPEGTSDHIHSDIADRLMWELFVYSNEVFPALITNQSNTLVRVYVCVSVCITNVLFGENSNIQNLRMKGNLQIKG